MRALRGIVASATLLALAVVPALMGITGCAEKTANTTVAPLSMEMPSLQSAGLHQDWTRSIHLEPGERVKKAWRVGLSVYVATTHSRIVRIDARTGVLVWSNGLGRENFDIFQPIELKSPDGGPSSDVLVVTRGEAFIFDMQTGDEMHAAAQLGMSVSTDPVLVGNTLGVGGADGFYGLYFDRLGLRHWRVPATGDLFDSSPIALDNNILLASRSGRLWRISADSGDWDWKDRKTNGEVVAGLAVDFNAVYVACMDQRVYAFRSDTGGELWEQQLVGRLETTPSLAGASVLVISQDHGMYAFARTSGVIQWHVDDVSQVAAIQEDSVWVGDAAGNIKHIAVEDGHQRATAPTPGVQIFIRNTVDNRVFLVGTNGMVGAYSPVK